MTIQNHLDRNPTPSDSSPTSPLSKQLAFLYWICIGLLKLTSWVLTAFLFSSQRLIQSAVAFVWLTLIKQKRRGCGFPRPYSRALRASLSARGFSDQCPCVALSVTTFCPRHCLSYKNVPGWSRTTGSTHGAPVDSSVVAGSLVPPVCCRTEWVWY